MTTTTTPPTDLAPVARGERIAALDVIRGFAVLGILVMNIPGFALPDGSLMDIWHGGSTLDLAVAYVQDFAFDGRMRGLFSLLFGAGALLLVERLAARGAGLSAADIYTRRLLWLLVGGLIHAWVLLWPGDILYGYAICGLIIFPFRRMAPGKAVLAGLALLSVGVAQGFYGEWRNDERHALAVEAMALQSAADDPDAVELSREQDDALGWWESRVESFAGDPEERARELEARQGGYADVWAAVAPYNLERQSKGLYTWGFFDYTGMMLVGMGLAGLGFFTGRWRTRRYVALCVLGYGVAMPLSAWITHDWISGGARPGQSDVAYETTYHFVRLAVALAYASTFVLLVRGGRLAGPLSALAATGRMALTHYVGQTVICGVILFGPVMGWFGELSLAQLMLVVLAVWTVQVAVSRPWLRRYRYGPLEWVWRSLTYGALQPMQRESTTPQEVAIDVGINTMNPAR